MDDTSLSPEPLTTQARTDWGTRNTAGVSIPAELAFDQVSHTIAEQNILSDVSFTARSGTVTCLLGPSGSGKTTLLRLAAGMERLSNGRILKDSQVISSQAMFVAPERRGIGVVFQDYALFPHMTVLKNILFGLRHLNRSEKKIQALGMLKRVGLENRQDAFPHELSGGEQQRIALARALAPRPGVLLMDEPFSGLDSRLRDAMREETLAVLRETKATSIIVTHDSEEALKMGDQIVLLQNGQLEQFGTGQDLYYRPRTLFAASFFSELNYFRSRVEQGRISTPLGPIPVNGVKPGEMAIAVVRVSSIGVEPVTPNSGASIEGRVLSTHFTGGYVQLRVGISGYEQPISVRVEEGTLPKAILSEGGPVSLLPRMDGCFAFPASG